MVSDAAGRQTARERRCECGSTLTASEGGQELAKNYSATYKNLNNYKLRNKLSLHGLRAVNYLGILTRHLSFSIANIYAPSGLLRKTDGSGRRARKKLPVHRKKINQMNYQMNVMPFQTMSKRAFDGLNNLKRLNLENNRLKGLERGVLALMPALAHLNLMRNSLETVTLHAIQPLMNNLLNHGSMLLIKGKFSTGPDCRVTQI